MLKEFLNRILELKDEPKITIDDRDYYKNGYNPCSPPLPDSITVMNLDGLVKFVTNGVKNVEFKEDIMVVVAHPVLVTVKSELDPNWRQRETYIKAVRSDYVKPFECDRYFPTDEFIINLKSKFVQDANIEMLVKLIGNISNDSSISENDDGFTQTVETKAGVHLKATEEIPNPIVLRPFRTFLEVEQPASLFLVRAQPGRGNRPEFALYEADGGAWKIDAIKKIKEYLNQKLGNDIPVIG
jgi:hypothetical protein